MKELLTRGGGDKLEMMSGSGGGVAKASKAARRRELESIIRNPKSLISIDSLLDGVMALVLDCEPMKKNKNIENFLNRCNSLIYSLKYSINVLISLDRCSSRKAHI